MATLSRGGGISSELAESLSANPLDDNAWQEIIFSNGYNKILYDNVNNIYYGIKDQLLNDNSTTIYIYKINEDVEELIGQHTYRYTYSSSNYITRLVDSCYSTYKGKILILIRYFFEIAECYYTEQFKYCLNEFDPNTRAFTDIDSFVHPDQFDNNFTNAITFRGCGIEVGEFNDEYTYTEYYTPSNMYIADNWLFFLCNEPKYSIFKLDLQNTSYNSSTVTDIDYDIYGNETGDDSSGNYVGIFTHCIGPWEDFLGELYRPYTSITGNAIISMAESKNYVVFGIVSEVCEGSGDPDYWDSYTHNYLHCVIFNKINGVATQCVSGYQLTYNNLTTHGTAVSCYDYENDKFLLSNLHNDRKQRIFDINPTTENLEADFIRYSTSETNVVYRVINLLDTYYTLYLFNHDIYIREGVNLDTIHDQSTYMLLNNIECTSSSGIFISESLNQFTPYYKSFIYKAYSAKYYGFIGEACLPLIDEEGMNAFIKIKN